MSYYHPFSRCGIDSQLPSDNGPCKYYRSHCTVACGMGGTRSLALDSNRHRALFLTVLTFSRSEHFSDFLQGIACFGAGMIVSSQAIQTYIIDSFALHAASGATLSIFYYYFLLITQLYLLIALAATSCLRSLAGFGFPLFAPAMFNKLGYGKGCTILACIAILLGCPAYVYLIH